MSARPEATLRDRLARTIASRGPITFAEFVEAALYDADEGFFSRAALGPRGDFVTSAHVSPAYGVLLTRELRAAWHTLGRPGRFDVVEIGAGDGTLARRIREAAAMDEAFAAALRYRAIERSAHGREALRAFGVEVADSLDAVAPVTGVVLANELLDNLPFHRLRERDGEMREVFVALDGDRFVEVEGAPTREALACLDRPLLPGEERPVSPAALALPAEIAGALARGYAVLVDYGFVAGETPEPVRGYRAHQLVADLVEDPGANDVTAPVDLDAVAGAARAAGLQVWGPVGQREALLALGYRGLLDELRERQAALEAEGEWRQAIRAYEARGKASMLVDRRGLGGLRVLALGTTELPPPLLVGDGAQEPPDGGV